MKTSFKSTQPLIGCVESKKNKSQTHKKRELKDGF